MFTRRDMLLASAALIAAACQPAAGPAPTQPPPAAPTQPPPKPAATTAPTTAPTIAPTTAATSAPTTAAKPTAPAATTAPAAAATTGPVVAIHASYSNLIADNLGAWMALDSGIFKNNGLDVTLDNIASSTGIPALLSGQTQIAHLGGSETVSAAAQGGDLVIVGITEPVYPFVFMAPADISDLQQMKGKKVGVSNPGSSSDIATRVMFTRVGMDPDKDVTIVAVGSLQNRTAALLNGAIDGGLAQPPDQLVLEDHGLHVIYDLAAQKLPSVGNCIVVQRSWMNENKPAMQRYMDSIIQAIALAKKNKEQTLPVLSKYLKNDDPRAIGVTYDFFVGSVTPDYPVVRADLFKDAIDQLSTQNESIKNFDLNSILDNDFVQSAMDRHVGG
jgi:NitT/TauT family transport system substrate-binding protein